MLISVPPVTTSVSTAMSALLKKQSAINPEFLLINDRQYTVSINNLINPIDLNDTRSKLFTIMAIYGSMRLLSKDTYANIMGVTRDAVNKLARKSINGLQY